MCVTYNSNAIFNIPGYLVTFKLRAGEEGNYVICIAITSLTVHMSHEYLQKIKQSFLTDLYLYSPIASSSSAYLVSNLEP